MHFHLLKDTPYAPALPRTALAGPAFGRPLAASAGGIDWSALMGKLARRWVNRRTVATLNSMDDRLLSDIGLRRDDIHSYVADIDASSPREQR